HCLCLFTGGTDCESYTDSSNTYHHSKTCWQGFCCGSCNNRFCCRDSSQRLSEDRQDECFFSHSFPHSPLPMILGLTSIAAILLIIFCCCVCPCCCIYKMCRKPRPVIATTTTTVVTTIPQQYPQQPTATPVQSYQGSQYPPFFQPVPVQPGYPAQPMPRGYGPQPMPTSPYQGQPFTAGPPPTYQEATGPAYPPNPMPYSQAAFTPGQPVYPLQSPAHPQPSGPSPHADYLAQPAYNPEYVAPPPKTG
uniref:Protein shisa-5 n=1 Tax=Mola mola TaxID=94237 RepID=A0A3Q4B762_MOLML